MKRKKLLGEGRLPSNGGHRSQTKNGKQPREKTNSMVKESPQDGRRLISGGIGKEYGMGFCWKEESVRGEKSSLS